MFSISRLQRKFHVLSLRAEPQRAAFAGSLLSPCLKKARCVQKGAMLAVLAMLLILTCQTLFFACSPIGLAEAGLIESCMASWRQLSDVLDSAIFSRGNHGKRQCP